MIDADPEAARPGSEHVALLAQGQWCTSYRYEDGDLIELFYNPVLTCAVQDNRMTGYFSADALALAARDCSAPHQRRPHAADRRLHSPAT